MSARVLLALASALEAGAAAAVRVLRAEAARGDVEAGEDALVPLGDAGLERAAARRLVASGELPARKIGRRWMVRRGDLARLVAARPAAPPAAEAPATYAAIVASVTGKGRRRAA